MARPSIIQHIPRMGMIVLWGDFVALCGEAPNAQVAAAILGQMLYWHENKLEHLPQAHAHNRAAQDEGGAATQDTELWVYKTLAELQAELLGLCGETAIAANMKWLLSAGYLDTRTHPDRPRDRTKQYLFRRDRVQPAITKLAEQTANTANMRSANRDITESENGAVDLRHGSVNLRDDTCASESEPEVTETTTENLPGPCTSYGGEKTPSVLRTAPVVLNGQDSRKESGNVNVKDSVSSYPNGAQADAVSGIDVLSDAELVVTCTEAINGRAWTNREKARRAAAAILAAGYTPEQVTAAYRQYAQDPTILKTLDAFARLAYSLIEKPDPGTLFENGAGVSRQTDGSREVWTAYCDSYQSVYHERPLNNARVNSQIGSLIKRTGIDAAIKLAAWFPGHRAQKYVSAGHTIGSLLSDCEKLHTEYKSGIMLHNKDAREIDRVSANTQMWQTIGIQTGFGMEVET